MLEINSNNKITNDQPMAESSGLAKKRWIILITIGIVVVALVVAAIIFLNNRDASNSQETNTNNIPSQEEIDKTIQEYDSKLNQYIVD